MELRPGSHVHMMGICGTAMASLAGLLKDRGFHVTGSDANPYPPMSTQIENLKIPLMKGYSAQNLDPQPDFVIVGNVISASNEEAQEMVRRGIPFTSLPKAMGELIIADRESVVISGTHGKTTTTSLMSWVAEVCGHAPGFLIGGVPKNFSLSFRNPHGKYFVIEGDEYDTAYFDKVPKFVHYKPRHVILTSVEFDHADIYKDLGAVKEAFLRLMHLIPADGTLIAYAEDENISELLPQCPAQKKFTYGFKKGDYQAAVLESNEQRTLFQVTFQGHVLGDFSMGLTGNFNVMNATAVVAMAHQLGFPIKKVQESLSSFEGVKRRQEILGEPGGVLLIEDFAHHPTAVRETVRAVQAKYSGRKVYSVFEPRSATSRRKVFQRDYVDAFSNCDEVLIAQAFDQSKIDSKDRFSVDELISDLQARKKSAGAFVNADAIVADLKARARKGDVILIMSNGGFDGIYQKLMTALGE